MKNFLKIVPQIYFKTLIIRINMLTVVLVLALIILHHIGIQWMADSRTIELVMASGQPPGIFAIISILAFIVLRVMVILILPGFILAWIISKLAGLLLEKK